MNTFLSGTLSPTTENRHDVLLAWYFVLVWGSGYLAAKLALLDAAPFTLLALRFGIGAFCMLGWLIASRPEWPASKAEFFHIGVAGILMHLVNLGGSHYAQYLGMSAGITALVLGTQPLLTALFAHYRMGQRLALLQWLGIALGLAGVALVVGHKIHLRSVSAATLVAIAISLAAITAGTLYQNMYCRKADLRSAALIQLSVSLLLALPLAWRIEGFAVNWSWALAGALMYLVIFSSIMAVNVLHMLMRRGHAAKVTSLLFLTPVVAVLLEWQLFGTVPGWTSAAGIAVTCSGVALVVRRKTA